MVVVVAAVVVVVAAVAEIAAAHQYRVAADAARVVRAEAALRVAVS